MVLQECHGFSGMSRDFRSVMVLQKCHIYSVMSRDFTNVMVLPKCHGSSSGVSWFIFRSVIVHLQECHGSSWGAPWFFSSAMVLHECHGSSSGRSSARRTWCSGRPVRRPRPWMMRWNSSSRSSVWLYSKKKDKYRRKGKGRRCWFGDVRECRTNHLIGWFEQRFESIPSLKQQRRPLPFLLYLSFFCIYW